MLYKRDYGSPLGKLLLVCDEHCLLGVWFVGQKYEMATLPQEPICDEKHPILAQTKDWLERYFNHEKPDISLLPLFPKGSEFRVKIWQILCEIPYGEVVTYGMIAKRLQQESGKAVSNQAVGGAVAHNPISIIIPCHRVIGSDGRLVGYAGGLERKRALLQLEGIEVHDFKIVR